ncbi:MAG: hypothetical protein EOL87_08430 [Spartobacteria bacterium]|nr:hypothetical protein [Spartobacteria bacterium]
MKEIKKNNTVKLETEVTAADYAIVFELEYLAAMGRDKYFDALKAVLAKYKVELTPALFARFCTGPHPRFYIEKLAAGCGISKVDELSKAALDAFDKCFAGDVTLNPALASLLKVAQENKISVHALSVLPPAKAEALKTALKLPADMDVNAFDSIEANFPRVDAWMKMTRNFGKKSRRCIVFATSSRTCKSALSADMRAIAVPDHFTGYQDFGGTDLELSVDGEWDNMAVLKELIPVMK